MLYTMRNNYKPYKMRWEVFTRDNFTCQYCGQSAPDVIITVDHKIPVNAGGQDSLDNLVTACQACNFGKSDNVPPFWGVYSVTKRPGRPPVEPSMKQRVIAFLHQHEQATATQIAEALHCSRPAVSALLNTSPKFILTRKSQEGAFYRVSTT